MTFDYYNLPYGGQLLLWTSRLFLYGSCKSKPNKYELIDMAYLKSGIKNGNSLIGPIMELLKESENFSLQRMCVRKLNHSEVMLTNCVESFKTKFTSNRYYIKAWDQEKNKLIFINKFEKLSSAYKKANLNTSHHLNGGIFIEKLLFNKLSNTVH